MDGTRAQVGSERIVIEIIDDDEDGECESSDEEVQIINNDDDRDRFVSINSNS